MDEGIWRGSRRFAAASRRALAREGGFGAGSWRSARERGDCEPALLGEESEGEGRDSDDDSERRGMKSLLEAVFSPLSLNLATQIYIHELLDLL